MVCKKLVTNRAGIGNQLLHGLSNVQAEFGNEVVDSEINGSNVNYLLFVGKLFVF